MMSSPNPLILFGQELWSEVVKASEEVEGNIILVRSNSSVIGVIAHSSNWGFFPFNLDGFHLQLLPL
jgi:hypothetical protein